MACAMRAPRDDRTADTGRAGAALQKDPLLALVDVLQVLDALRRDSALRHAARRRPRRRRQPRAPLRGALRRPRGGLPRLLEPRCAPSTGGARRNSRRTRRARRRCASPRAPARPPTWSRDCGSSPSRRRRRAPRRARTSSAPPPTACTHVCGRAQRARRPRRRDRRLRAQAAFHSLSFAAARRTSSCRARQQLQGARRHRHEAARASRAAVKLGIPLRFVIEQKSGRRPARDGKPSPVRRRASPPLRGRGVAASPLLRMALWVVRRAIGGWRLELEAPSAAVRLRRRLRLRLRAPRHASRPHHAASCSRAPPAPSAPSSSPSCSRVLAMWLVRLADRSVPGWRPTSLVLRTRPAHPPSCAPQEPLRRAFGSDWQDWWPRAAACGGRQPSERGRSSGAEYDTLAFCRTADQPALVIPFKADPCLMRKPAAEVIRPVPSRPLAAFVQRDQPSRRRALTQAHRDAALMICPIAGSIAAATRHRRPSTWLSWNLHLGPTRREPLACASASGHRRP